MKRRLASLLLVAILVLGMLPGGVLAAEGATTVSDQNGLAGMADGGSYIMTQDITLSDWTAIDFSGTLDGNGHTITLSGTPLFTTLNGTVQNLCLDGSVTAETSSIYDYMYVVAKEMTGGSIKNCWSGVTINSGGGMLQYGGGLVYKMTGGTVNNCLVTGSLESDLYGVAYQAPDGTKLTNCFWVGGKGVPASAKSGVIDATNCEKITDGDYSSKLGDLNDFAAENGLRSWVAGDDNIPKPTGEASSGGGEVTPGEVDKTALQAQLAEAAAKEKDKDNYTSTSWENFQKYMTDAKEVNENPNAEQAAVDETAENLKKAFGWLIVQTDFQNLSDQIDACDALRDHKDEYTTGSWDAVWLARGEAMTVYTKADSLRNTEVTNQNVIDAYAELKTAMEALVKIEVVSIGSVDDLKAMDGTGRYQLTADLTLPADWSSTATLTGHFDGAGHAIAMQGGGPLFETVNGEIVHLGITGTVTGGGAFAETINGTVENCYTWADVSNESKPAGGFAGTSGEDVKIANSYAAGTVAGSPAGGLVGQTAEYFDFKTAYWVNGTSADEEDWFAGTQMTLEAMKESAFRETLNQKAGTVVWNRSESGLPWFGDHHAEEAGTLAYPVVMTDLITNETQKISKEDGVLTTDVFGQADGYVAQLKLEGYDGSIWWTTDQDYNYPVTVAAGDGQVRAIGTGSVTVTAWNMSPMFDEAEQIQSFRLTVTQPETFDLALKIDGTDYAGRSYTMAGTSATIVPFVTLSGDPEQQVAPELFIWTSDAPDVVNVGTRGGLTAKANGAATITVSLGGVTETITVSRDYIAVTGITSNFDSEKNGAYVLHSRNPNSIGNGATVVGGADFNPLRNGDSITSQYKIASVTPENATYQGFTVTSDNTDVLQFVAGTLQSLVPRKAGTAHLTVTSQDPQLSQQMTDISTVILEYFNPLTSLTAERNTLTLKVGETIDAGLIFKGPKSNEGYHVSESDMAWTQSGDGQVLPYRSYPVLMENDDGFNPEEGYVANDEWLIKGVKAGTVTLTGTPLDNTYQGAPITLTITVQADEDDQEQPVQTEVKNALRKTAQYIYGSMPTPVFTNEWSVLGLARADFEVPDNYYELYYADVYEQVQQEREDSRPWDNKVTETQRLALALTAIGKDPTDVGGVNLLDYSWNKGTYWNGAILGQMQGSNELIFALLAIEAHDSFQSSKPASVAMTEQQMIDKLLTYQTVDGGFGLSDNLTEGVDITAMALQTLAKHYNDNAAVKAAVDKAVVRLSSLQAQDGGFGNPEATSQVLVALTALGIDPDADERFVKYGSSVVDGLLLYALDDGSFSRTPGGQPNGMATEQALYALAALDRFYDKENSLYDMNDVALGDETGTAVTGVTLTPASAELKIGKTVQLNALVIPATAENKAVIFSSDNPAVATVSDTGLVTGVAEGTATITVTTKDGGKTAAATITVTKPEEIKPEDKATVTLSIDKLTIDKGYVLKPTEVEIKKGETVWDVLKRELNDRGIDYQYSNNSQYNSVYVESIDGDGEFDHGPGSGWKYSVDGVYPDYGCSLYELSGGEVIKWRYTTNLGADLGDDPNGGQTGKPEQGGSSTIAPEAKPDKNGSVQVTVDETQMKDAIAAAKTEGSDTIAIAPQITGKAAKVMAEVPTQSLKDMVKNTDAALEVRTDVGSVSIPNDALDAIAQQAGGSTVTIAVEAKNAADVKDQVSAARLEGAAVVEVTITSGKKELTTFGGKSLTIAIPVTDSNFTAGEAYKVVVLSADGAQETVIGTCTKQNGKLSVQVKIVHLSTFVVTTQKAMPFTDVTGHWAAEAIAWVYGNDLMNGTSETTFAPNATLNRAMLATILYRMAGESAVTGEGETFADVAPDTWYSAAVVWASANGIVSGVGDNQFAPMQAITREQLATMLYRYAQCSKLDTGSKGDLSKFTDGGQVSVWASDAMAWAVGTGLISGKTASTIDPAGTATRAEVATILMRFTELTK